MSYYICFLLSFQFLPLFFFQSSFTMTSSFSPFPIDLNEDQNHLFSSSKTTEDHNYASSSSSISYPFFISQQSPYYHSHFFHPLHHQDEGENIYGGSLDHGSTENESGNKLSVCREEDRENSTSVKWMSSKMRLMRKMMKSNQMVGNNSSENSKFEEDQIKGQSSSLEFDDNSTTNNTLLNNNNNNNSIRVCADCSTTKTPLWRSGPRGPKSLCNACGIRQRKARRALAVAQEGGNEAMFETNSTGVKVQNKEKRRKNSHLPFKKRCKFTGQGKGRKKVCFEDLSSVILSKNNSAFQQVFPQDEKEAAILLMALSYGLVRG